MKLLPGSSWRAFCACGRAVRKELAPKVPTVPNVGNLERSDGPHLDGTLEDWEAWRCAKCGASTANLELRLCCIEHEDCEEAPEVGDACFARTRKEVVDRWRRQNPDVRVVDFDLRPRSATGTT